MKAPEGLVPVFQHLLLGVLDAPGPDYFRNNLVDRCPVFVVVLNYNLLVLEGKLFKKIQKKTESLL
jgi:hypothetical protein